MKHSDKMKHSDGLVKELDGQMKHDTQMKPDA